MNCPRCESKMWMCGTFGVVWNCECGYSQTGTEEEQEAVEAFKREYHQRMNERDPKDIACGASLRLRRVGARIFMRDIARTLGCTSAQISAWELGIVPITDEQQKCYIEALRVIEGRKVP